MAQQTGKILTLYEWYDVTMTFENEHDGENESQLCVHAPDQSHAVIMALLALDNEQHGHLKRVSVAAGRDTFTGKIGGIGLISPSR